MIDLNSDGGSHVRGKPRAATHDEYLAALPREARAALEKLRQTVRTATPGAEECMSYQLPAFRLYGKVLVLFGAMTKHCSFYPGSGTAVENHKGDLEVYSRNTFKRAKPKP